MISLPAAVMYFDNRGWLLMFNKTLFEIARDPEYQKTLAVFSCRCL